MSTNRILTAILALLLVSTVVFTAIMTSIVSKNTKQETIESTQTIAQAQLSAVEEFVKKQEDRLLDYSRAPEIKRMLQIKNQYETASSIEKAALDKEFFDAQQIVQKYIEDISITPEEGGVDEGIYVSTWNTEVLAHTNKATVGISTRKTGTQALVDLQTAMTEAGDNSVYNTGIILSPVGTHEQIVSLYKGVFDENGNPIGLVGMGVYTEELEKELGFDITGLPNAKFLMVNVKDGKYIFNEKDTIKNVIIDENGTESYEYKTTTNEELLSLCKKYKDNSKNSQVGEYTYDDNVAVYAYSKDYGWLFQIEDYQKEMFNTATRVKSFMIILLVTIGIVMLIVFIINSKMVKIASALSRTIERQEKTRKALDESMDKDVLSQAKSRLSFIDEYSNIKGRRKPIYFIMHSFQGLADINLNLGLDRADNYIMEFAQSLNKIYGAQNVFRTSSNEFVCVKDGENTTVQEILNNVGNVHNQLSSAKKLADGTVLNPNIDTAVVKQTELNNLNVLPILKDISKKQRPIYGNAIPFVDLDVH